MSSSSHSAKNPAIARFATVCASAPRTSTSVPIATHTPSHHPASPASPASRSVTHVLSFVRRLIAHDAEYGCCFHGRRGFSVLPRLLGAERMHAHVEPVAQRRPHEHRLEHGHRLAVA